MYSLYKITNTFHNNIIFVQFVIFEYKNTWIYWVNKPLTISIICPEETLTINHRFNIN